jgi:hypothetical protein
MKGHGNGSKGKADGNGKDLNRRERPPRRVDSERKGRQRMFLLEKKGLGLSPRSLRSPR